MNDPACVRMARIFCKLPVNLTKMLPEWDAIDPELQESYGHDLLWALFGLHDRLVEPEAQVLRPQLSQLRDASAALRALLPQMDVMMGDAGLESVAALLTQIDADLETLA